MFSFISSRTEWRELNSDSRSSCTLLEFAWCHQQQQKEWIQEVTRAHWQEKPLNRVQLGLNFTSASYVSVPPGCRGSVWECRRSWKALRSSWPACGWSYAGIPTERDKMLTQNLMLPGWESKAYEADHCPLKPVAQRAGWVQVSPLHQLTSLHPLWLNLCSSLFDTSSFRLWAAF